MGDSFIDYHDNKLRDGDKKIIFCEDEGHNNDEEGVLDENGGTMIPVWNNDSHMLLRVRLSVIS